MPPECFLNNTRKIGFFSCGTLPFANAAAKLNDCLTSVFNCVVKIGIPKDRIKELYKQSRPNSIRVFGMKST